MRLIVEGKQVPKWASRFRKAEKEAAWDREGPVMRGIFRDWLIIYFILLYVARILCHDHETSSTMIMSLAFMIVFVMSVFRIMSSNSLSDLKATGIAWLAAFVTIQLNVMIFGQ